MTRKRSSMFDDDEDLGLTPQALLPDPAQETKPAEVGLFNDEAAALIDAKAKQAAEQATRAAKAGMAAAGRAAVALKAKGEQLKGQVQSKREGSKRPLVIGMVAIVFVVGGAIGWWVWSKEKDHAEPQQSVVPVVPAPAPITEPAPQPEAEAPPAPAEEVAPQPAPETQEVLPEMPMIPPAGSAYGSPQASEDPAPVQVRAPEPVRQDPVPVAATPKPKAASIQQRPTSVEQPKPASVVAKPTAPKPAPKQAAPVPAPIGEREQQQIEQIRSLFGDKP
jgi:cytoskeletal protein RodZ